MARKPKEDQDLKRVKQLDEDPESLKGFYEHYRDTCVENGGQCGVVAGDFGIGLGIDEAVGGKRQ